MDDVEGIFGGGGIVSFEDDVNGGGCVIFRDCVGGKVAARRCARILIAAALFVVIRAF